MPDEFDADAQQDDTSGPVEAQDDGDLEARPGEPGYVQTRLKRVKDQRDAARREAAEKDGELRAMRDRLSALEARPLQPAAAAEAKEDPNDVALRDAEKFLADVETLKIIALTDDDEGRVAAAKKRLASLPTKDVAFAHSEIARVQGLKAAQAEGKKTLTHLDGRARQDDFKERLKQEFGPDAVNAKSELFQKTLEKFRENIQMFPDDSSGAVTWMSMRDAKAELEKKNRAGRGSDLDRRRLAIEGQARREGQLSNTIAALKQRGDSNSQLQASSLELTAFLKQNGYSVGE